MGRRLRGIVAGETYHAFTRGSNKLPIFFEPLDLTVFLLQLARVVANYGWVLYSYCLMPNHYHLLVGVPHGGLSEGMRDLNGGFSRRMEQAAQPCRAPVPKSFRAQLDRRRAGVPHSRAVRRSKPCRSRPL